MKETILAAWDSLQASVLEPQIDLTTTIHMANSQPMSQRRILVQARRTAATIGDIVKAAHFPFASETII